MRECVGGPGAPHPHGGLVGRERESAALRELLAEHRLVTVTGAVGVGKSRLACAAAGAVPAPWRRVVRVRRRGSGADRPGALAAAVLQALTGRRPGGTVVEVGDLVRQLPAEDVLLFLDDVDPVHAECVRLVQRLLMAVPTLRVLVTARRALGLGEERVLALAPLPTEAPDGGSGPAPAVELFLERARAAAAGFAADGDDLAAVAAICRSVEGFPLAVELAAEQVAHYPVRHLADLVERHQCWLHSPRPAPRRHRSLRDALGAAYALCDRAVRIVWGRASVFAGAFDESAAVFVCAGGGIGPHDVSVCLAHLAAVGVLEPLHDPGGPRGPRYRMRRAARDFGAERLGEAGEFEVAAERRVAHCRQVASTAETLWSTGCQAQAVRLVQDEHDDLTAMVRYALGRPDHAPAALATVVDLWFWWAVYGRAEEGRGQLLRLLPLCPADSVLATRGRWLAAWLSASSDPGTARALLARAWPAAVLAGDDATVGRIAHVQGMLAFHQGDARGAAEHFQEAAATLPYDASGGPSRAVSLAALAVAQAAFAPRAARRSARRALAQPGIHADTWAGILARYARAYADHRDGRSGRAWHRARRALASLDKGVPEPHGCGALRQLIAAIEAGVHGGLPRAEGERPRSEPRESARVCVISLAGGCREG
ncbi:ATP-binding protein [Streptomyces sp. NPDC059063]|uniref:ATP-binding protein n=1 Tax=unclassified Streptomyces TaxID=2593676 RepID=UPI00369FC5F0